MCAARLPAGAAQGLVNHDACVGHRVSLALGAGAQQERAHGRRQAKAIRLHVRAAQLRARAAGLSQWKSLDNFDYFSACSRL